jgi:hypothetical protein
MSGYLILIYALTIGFLNAQSTPAFEAASIALGDPGNRGTCGQYLSGRRNIQNQRASHPDKKRFTVRRMTGGGDLWITEFTLTYDGKPSFTVSIMEFSGGKVERETQYFSDPFAAPAWRAQWVERMDA